MRARLGPKIGIARAEAAAKGTRGGQIGSARGCLWSKNDRAHTPPGPRRPLIPIAAPGCRAWEMPRQCVPHEQLQQDASTTAAAAATLVAANNDYEISKTLPFFFLFFVNEVEEKTENSPHE
jgi:hypothetical protein